MSSYLGAKSGAGVYQAIINVMPPHDTYIETHFGSGAIMTMKAPAARSFAVDLDQDPLRKYPQSHTYPGLELVQACAAKFLREFQFTDRTLVYCDPPYLLSTRTSNARYRYEYTENDHLELLKTLLAMSDRASIIISGYRNQLYDDQLVGWNSLDFQAMTRGGVRTETIWFNYDLGSVHWHKYAGVNFTDRQRIKRKAERWSNRFKLLPPGERQTILAALLEVECFDRS